MKFRLLAASAVALALASPAARGGTQFATAPGISLTSVFVVIGPTGVTGYRFAGVVAPAYGPNLEFTGQCGYDPQQRRAQEHLVETKTGNVITTKATCNADPWRREVACTGGQISSPGYSPAVAAAINNLPAPISAGVMSDSDRQTVDAAYNGQVAANAAAADKAAADKAAAVKAAAEKAEAERKAKLAVRVVPVGKTHASDSKYVLNTPTPDPHKVGVVALNKESAARKFALGTPTPPPRPRYPPYGAAYSWSAVIVSMTVNQNLIMPITVRNLSSQTWPAGGAFRLSYHWYRGGAELIHDGARTVLPAALAPGDSVTLAAKLNAPPSAGVSACRWDMVEETTGFQQATTWFSEKNVAMSAPQTVRVVP